MPPQTIVNFSAHYVELQRCIWYQSDLIQIRLAHRRTECKLQAWCMCYLCAQYSMLVRESMQGYEGRLTICSREILKVDQAHQRPTCIQGPMYSHKTRARKAVEIANFMNTRTKPAGHAHRAWEG
jgi:hypothetical protein